MNWGWLRKKGAITLAPFFLFFLPTISHAVTCLYEEAPLRLYNHCTVHSLDGAILSASQYELITDRLGEEGVGINEDATFSERFFNDSSLGFSVIYDRNLNGGNPDKPLVISGMTFVGDDELYRKSGYAGYASGYFKSKFFFGNERYLEAYLNYSAQSSISGGILKTSSLYSICSKNHISRSIYADLCLSQSSLKSDISDSGISDINLSISKIISYDDSNHLMLGGNVSSSKYEDYEQGAFKLYLSSIGEYGNLNLSYKFYDSPDVNFLTNKKTLSSAYTNLIYGRPFTLFYSKNFSDGLEIINEDIEIKTTIFGISTYLTKELKITISRVNQDSSNYYFSDDYNNMSLTYSF